MLVPALLTLVPFLSSAAAADAFNNSDQRMLVGTDSCSPGCPGCSGPPECSGIPDHPLTTNFVADVALNNSGQRILDGPTPVNSTTEGCPGCSGPPECSGPPDHPQCIDLNSNNSDQRTLDEPISTNNAKSCPGCHAPPECSGIPDHPLSGDFVQMCTDVRSEINSPTSKSSLLTYYTLSSYSTTPAVNPNIVPNSLPSWLMGNLIECSYPNISAELNGICVLLDTIHFRNYLPTYAQSFPGSKSLHKDVHDESTEDLHIDSLSEFLTGPDVLTGVAQMKGEL